MKSRTGPAADTTSILAEFPFFHFDKNPDHPLKEAITYTDTITGKDGISGYQRMEGLPQRRIRFRRANHTIVFTICFSSTLNKACKGNQIQFGTLYNLLQRRGIRTPKYTRLPASAPRH